MTINSLGLWEIDMIIHYNYINKMDALVLSYKQRIILFTSLYFMNKWSKILVKNCLLPCKVNMQYEPPILTEDIKHDVVTCWRKLLLLVINRFGCNQTGQGRLEWASQKAAWRRKNIYKASGFNKLSAYVHYKNMIT